jgi:ribosomal protein L35
VSRDDRAVQKSRLRGGFFHGRVIRLRIVEDSRASPVALFRVCGYKRPSERSGRACRGRSLCLKTGIRQPVSIQEQWSSKMPKMKTKSSAKKRFKITASGKVLAAAAGKRHGMIKRSNKFIRDARGTMVLAEPDGKKVIKNYLPNGL